jgi:hypothetical protein
VAVLSHWQAGFLALGRDHTIDRAIDRAMIVKYRIYL